MAHNLIVSSDEYLLLRSIARLARYAAEDGADEIRALLVEKGCSYDAQYRDDMPPPHGEVSDNRECKNDSASRLRNAADTANGLMSIGLNGPRLGHWPVEPSNLMCEGAATIRALLEALSEK